MQSALFETVEYGLPVGNQLLKMNDILGKSIRLEYLGEIHCIKCGRKTNKSFSQGFCYPCFLKAPETEECVLRPELCLAHEGRARDMAYAERNCLSEHVVYLSVTSGLKVGVTRHSQVPTRWIDQGAVHAIELSRTPNRYLAGLIEVALKQHMMDKTNWRAMLKNEISFDGDLLEEKVVAISLLPAELALYRSDEDEITTIEYPVSTYPEKAASLNLDKNPEYSGTLTGIKGQYLIFEDNSVINMRKYGGYKLRISFSA
ncbi:DUF2797 domain-containing protein [Bacteroidota bacterium]